jgi:hypothetical protein
MLVPNFKSPASYLAHTHFDARWAARVNDRGGGLGHLWSILRTLAQVIGWVVMIVFAAWAIVALAIALVHVMTFWASPGLP